MSYNRGLFHNWVPKLGMLLLIVLLLTVFLFINPIYISNIGQMVSSTGIISEYFMWGNFATTIGMALVLPFILRLKMRFRSKELMVTSLVVMALMSVVIATTSSGEVVVGASLIFGIMKMMGMVEVILPVMFILSPSGDKKIFYASFYPIAIVSGQLSAFLASVFSLEYNWQMMHFYSAATLLIVALLCIIVMHNSRFARKMPLYYIDWLGVLLFGTTLMCMAYVFTFGKQQDWFVSPNIHYATIGSIVSAVLLITRQLSIKHPFLSFKFYRQENVLFGLVLLIGQGMFMGASSLLTIHTTAILGYNWIMNSSLNLMMIPGMIASGFVAFHWVKNKLPMKMYIFLGFAAYVLYTVMLYFMMVPQLNIEQFYLPQLLAGYGMCSLFISVWIYTFDKVPQNMMLPFVAPIMVFRSFIVIAFFTGLFGWLQYKLQWQSINNLALYFDAFTVNINSEVEALRDVQLGAILAANKTLLGYIIMAGLGLLALILVHPFGEFQYGRIKESMEEKEISDAQPQQMGI